MPTITQQFEFDSGHRILNHGSKCRHIHGHRYVAEVTICSQELDSLGMVIDFGDVKKIIGEWLDKYWDHNLILNYLDPLATLISPEQNAGKAPYLLTLAGARDSSVVGLANPTVENLARVLFEVCGRIIPDPLEVKKVRIWETPKCSAEFP